ncbi:DUF3826 domain-containing protein [Pedobacter alpinus]|uniref:DUF3826 domain-containing protein n=1 Tax=Pedobacter alpinus TaxID=1590643 RepID=A0ABW5TP39_9SPHI
MMKTLIPIIFLFILFTNTIAQDNDYKLIANVRAAKIVVELHLSDTVKAQKVKALVANQYATLNAIHSKRDQDIQHNRAKTASIKAKADEAVKVSHQNYIYSLNQLLSKDQVEEVKNGMTYHTVPLTYANYLLMLPYATHQQQEMIWANLIAAREQAMDGGSSKEKHAWFNKYKGKIANQLSAEGYDLKKEGDDWAKRRDTKSTSLEITQSNKIIQVLNLQDKAKAESVRNLVAYQYQKIGELNKQWKNRLMVIDSLAKSKEEIDKEAAKAWEQHKAALDQQRTIYLTKLGSWLNSAQIEIVKNEMTANGLHTEFSRFQELLPNLTEVQKAKVYQYLLEARENALNVLTSRERNQWFIKYRGRANNYLSAEGYDLRKATEEIEKKQALNN